MVRLTPSATMRRKSLDHEAQGSPPVGGRQCYALPERCPRSYWNPLAIRRDPESQQVRLHLGTRLAARQPSGSVGRTVSGESGGNPASALAHYRLVFLFREGKVVRGDIHQFRRGRIGPRIGTVVHQAEGSVRVGLMGEPRPTFPCAPPAGVCRTALAHQVCRGAGRRR